MKNFPNEKTEKTVHATDLIDVQLNEKFGTNRCLKIVRQKKSDIRLQHNETLIYSQEPEKNKILLSATVKSFFF